MTRSLPWIAGLIAAERSIKCNMIKSKFVQLFISRSGFWGLKFDEFSLLDTVRSRAWRPPHVRFQEFNWDVILKVGLSLACRPVVLFAFQYLALSLFSADNKPTADCWSLCLSQAYHLNSITCKIQVSCNFEKKLSTFIE